MPPKVNLSTVKPYDRGLLPLPIDRIESQISMLKRPNQGYMGTCINTGHGRPSTRWGNSSGKLGSQMSIKINKMRADLWMLGDNFRTNLNRVDEILPTPKRRKIMIVPYVTITIIDRSIQRPLAKTHHLRLICLRIKFNLLWMTWKINGFTIIGSL